LNIDTPRIKVAKLSEKDIIDLDNKGYQAVEYENLNFKVNEKLNLDLPRNQLKIIPFNMKRVMNNDKYGLYYVRLEKKGIRSCWGKV